MHAFSKAIVESLYRHCSLAQEKKPIYIYGVEILCSTGLSFLSMLFVSLITDQIYCYFSFLILFFGQRMFAGGYHAKTYLHCFLLTNMVFMSVLVTGGLALHYHIVMIIPLLLSVSSLIILHSAPVRNSNHPLSENVYKRNQLISRVMVALFVSVILFFYLWGRYIEYLYFPVFSMAAVAAMMIPTLKGRRKR